MLYDLITLLNEDLFTAVIQRVLRSEAPYLEKLELVSLTEDLLKITNPECKGINLLVEELFGQKHVSLTGIQRPPRYIALGSHSSSICRYKPYSDFRFNAFVGNAAGFIKYTPY